MAVMIKNSGQTTLMRWSIHFGLRDTREKFSSLIGADY